MQNVHDCGVDVLPLRHHHQHLHHHCQHLNHYHHHEPHHHHYHHWHHTTIMMPFTITGITSTITDVTITPIIINTTTATISSFISTFTTTTTTTTASRERVFQSSFSRHFRPKPPNLVKKIFAKHSAHIFHFITIFHFRAAFGPFLPNRRVKETLNNSKDCFNKSSLSIRKHVHQIETSLYLQGPTPTSLCLFPFFSNSTLQGKIVDFSGMQTQAVGVCWSLDNHHSQLKKILRTPWLNATYANVSSLAFKI